MRILRYLSFVLAFAVICCALFSVSAYAVRIEEYSYNGVILPRLPDTDCPAAMISVTNDGTYYLLVAMQLSDWNETELYVHSGYLYNLRGDDWVLLKTYTGGNTYSYFNPVWSNRSVAGLTASDPVLNVYYPPINYSDFKSVSEAFTGQISVKTLVTILAAAVGCSVGLVFLWWGARKVSGALITAFKKGKIRI